MTLAPAPIPAARALPTPAEIIAAAADSPDGRATFHGVPWSLYEDLLDAVGDGPPRLTYDDGTLEMEMPSDLHELLKGVADKFLNAYMDEFGIDSLSYGSMTLRRKARRGGLEGDQAYYIQNYRAVVGRRIDLGIHPPPDLAVEIDLSPPAVEKASIYGRLGVPELWRWRDGRLAVFGRADDGTYAELGRSVALPEFPLDLLAAEFARTPHADQAAAAREFRNWCRQRAAADRAAERAVP